MNVEGGYGAIIKLRRELCLGASGVFATIRFSSLAGCPPREHINQHPIKYSGHKCSDAP